MLNKLLDELAVGSWNVAALPPPGQNLLATIKVHAGSAFDQTILSSGVHKQHEFGAVDRFTPFSRCFRVAIS